MHCVISLRMIENFSLLLRQPLALFFPTLWNELRGMSGNCGAGSVFVSMSGGLVISVFVIFISDGAAFVYATDSVG